MDTGVGSLGWRWTTFRASGTGVGKGGQCSRIPGRSWPSRLGPRQHRSRNCTNHRPNPISSRSISGELQDRIPGQSHARTHTHKQLRCLASCHKAKCPAVGADHCAQYLGAFEGFRGRHADGKEDKLKGARDMTGRWRGGFVCGHRVFQGATLPLEGEFMILPSPTEANGEKPAHVASRRCPCRPTPSRHTHTARARVASGRARDRRMNCSSCGRSPNPPPPAKQRTRAPACSRMRVRPSTCSCLIMLDSLARCGAMLVMRVDWCIRDCSASQAN